MAGAGKQGRRIRANDAAAEDSAVTEHIKNIRAKLRSAGFLAISETWAIPLKFRGFPHAREDKIAWLTAFVPSGMRKTGDSCNIQKM